MARGEQATKWVKMHETRAGTKDGRDFVQHADKVYELEAREADDVIEAGQGVEVAAPKLDGDD